MKGLEVAERFFNEWGLPYLRSEFPQISERLAAIVCGGSQSLGNDDELSQDHGWGPGFKLILTEEDRRHFGKRLHKAINDTAPREWIGYKWRWPDTSIEVHSLNEWLRDQIGCSHPPKTSKSWIKKTNEQELYMLRHATVMHDPLGEFTSRRKAFCYYPQSAWFRRLADETFNVWHFGQYNFLCRLTRRKDPIAISVCLGNFIQATMKLCMLLEEDYVPYWKWLAADFRKLSNIADLEVQLAELSACNDIGRQAVLVDAICKDIHSRLVTKGLVSTELKGHHDPLFCARNELRAKAMDTF